MPVSRRETLPTIPNGCAVHPVPYIYTARIPPTDISTSLLDREAPAWYRQGLILGKSMALAPHERYQFKPFTGSSHWWALGRCAQLNPSGKVLDIGSGSGAIGRELKQRGWQSLTAVEIDAEARAHVRDIYGRIEAGIEPLGQERYDLILMLDVIEHMTAPEEFVRTVSGMLNPGGWMLISVPNVAHWSIRLSLLVGAFNYTERGILDRTHFQFFTRKRVRSIVNAIPDLRLDALGASIEPAEFVLPNFIWNNSAFEALRKARWSVAQTLPGLCAFQHLAAIQKK